MLVATLENNWQTKSAGHLDILILMWAVDCLDELNSLLAEVWCGLGILVDDSAGLNLVVEDWELVGGLALVVTKDKSNLGFRDVEVDGTIDWE